MSHPGHFRPPARTVASRVFVALGLALAGLTAAAPVAAAAVTPDTVLTPTALTGDDVFNTTNPMSGQYRWMGYGAKPDGTPSSDVYFRDQTYWGRLEPSKGTYNWAPVEQLLSNGASTQGAAGMRVMAYCPGCWMNSRVDWPGWGAVTPSFLPLQAGTDIPDWNSESFLSSWESFMKAFGDKYRNDPRLTYLDVGGYGAYGEEQDGSGTSITDANYQRMVAAVATNFPNKWVLVNTITAPTRIKPALDKFSNVGMRIDNLGCFAGAAGEMYSWVPVLPELQEYWKTRPFLTEYCSSADLARAAKQVQDWHISTISSGNFRADLADPTNLANFKSVVSSSGYRYRVAELKVAGGVTEGVAANGTLTWNNDGSAPTYFDWDAVLSVTNGTVTKDIPLSTNFRTALPGATVTNFQLPADLTAGTWTASVKVNSKLSQFGPMNLMNAGRNADGSYRLGDFTVNAKPAYQPANGTISGNVFEDLNKDAALTAGEPGQGNYTVTLTDKAGVKRTVQTAADGTYTFTDVAPGDYTVSVALVAPFTGSSSTLSEPAAIVDGDAVTGINFGLTQPVIVPQPQPGSIAGNVFEDLNKDATFEPGEPGQGAYDVTIAGANGFTRTVKTGIDGSYSFTGVQPGDYTVTVALRAPFDASTTGLSKSATIVDANNVTGINFGLTQPVIVPAKPGTVSGTVFEDINKDATFGAGEPRIADYTVTLTDKAGIAKTVKTAADGTYSFADVAPGDYTVTVTVNAPYTAATTGLSKPAAITDGNTVTGINFGLTQPPVVIIPKPGTISGTVFEDVNKDGKAGADEPGIGSYAVTLSKAGAQVASVQTAADGTFTFADVAPGDYTVTVAADATYTSVTTASTGTATIVDGDKVTGLAFGLAKPVIVPAKSGTVSGTVFEDLNKDGKVSAGEAGIGGYVVTLTNAAGKAATVKTGADGTYSFADVAPGTYTVSVSAIAPYLDATTALTGQAVITDGNTVTVTFGVAKKAQSNGNGNGNGKPPVVNVPPATPRGNGTPGVPAQPKSAGESVNVPWTFPTIRVPESSVAVQTAPTPAPSKSAASDTITAGPAKVSRTDDSSNLAAIAAGFAALAGLTFGLMIAAARRSRRS